MNKGKGAIFTGVNEDFLIKEFELTHPDKGMALIELIASGICGTDVHFHKGLIPLKTPTIIGHEFVGVVREIAQEDSENSGIYCGDNVIVCIACPCGECKLCLAGDDANCVNMGVTNSGDINVSPHLYGGYVEYNYSPIKNLIKIPKSLDPKLTCVFPCAGPTAIHAIRLGRLAGVSYSDMDTVVVQGTGPVGMFALLYLKSLKIKNIIAITLTSDHNKTKSAINFGATKVFNLMDNKIEDITEEIIKISGGYGADLVFEASGNKSAVPQGMNMLRNRGVYLIPGQYSNSGWVEIAPQMITFKALHLIGSSQYSLIDINEYLTFLENNINIIDSFKDIITEYKIDDINIAFKDIKEGKNIKSILIK